MVVSSTGTLIGIIFLAICVIVLIGIGIATIRSGRASLARAANQELVWHRQITFLFGLCNFVFAALLILILFLIVLVIQIIKLIVFVLLGIVFVLSIVLIIRCVRVALQSTRSAVTQPQDKEL
jgi:Ca2+/Na+ antiporter